MINIDVENRQGQSIFQVAEEVHPQPNQLTKYLFEEAEIKYSKRQILRLLKAGKQDKKLVIAKSVIQKIILDHFPHSN